jgi:CubicO group peptidase (beta-lactamase class C family)
MHRSQQSTPALGAPQVLEGFDAAGAPLLRPAKHAITLKHLLTHTAGFTYEQWNADTLRYVEATGTPRMMSGRRASLQRPLAFEPGEKWEYGVSIDWVGRIIEEVTGRPLDAYLQERIFAPLAMGAIPASCPRPISTPAMPACISAEPMAASPRSRCRRRRPRSYSAAAAVSARRPAIT